METSMSNIRLIARLDIKGPNLIKGIHLEGLRVVGDPQEYAGRYFSQGIDELIYIDAVASLYGRNSLSELVKNTARNLFIPLTVGGGIRSVSDVRNLLRSGADKIAINTAAIQNPELLTELSETFGAQCIVLSIQAKQSGDRWEAYMEGGREHSHLDVVEWAQKAEQLGVGEILLTSVDQEGTRKGFDIQLTRSVSEAVGIPVIASGGMGSLGDPVNVVTQGKADAVAVASVIHYNQLSLEEIRKAGLDGGINFRIPLGGEA